MTKSDDKRVPVLRFKGFTDDWEQRKLGDIAKTYSGGTPSVTNKNFYNNGYIPFIKSGEIGSSKTEQKINNDGLNNSSAKLVKTGTLLYALYGATSGKAAISPINGAINQAVLAIIPQTNVNRFIYEWLNKNKPRITEKYLQGGQGNLSAKIIKQINIFTTSKNEELKISDILGIVEKIISLQQRKVNDLKLIRKSVSQTIFPGNNKTESKILVDKTKEVWKKEKAKNIFKEIDIRKVPNNIILSTTQDGRVVTRESLGRNLLFSQDKLKNYKLVKSGQFIIHLRSFKGGFATSNLVGIVSPTYTIFDFKDKDENDSHFWSILFTRYNFIQSLKSVTEGIRYNGVAIKFSQFADLKITYPTLKTQLKISNLFRSLNNDIEKQEFKITKLQELKQFLLQNMFI